MSRQPEPGAPRGQLDPGEDQTAEALSVAEGLLEALGNPQLRNRAEHHATIAAAFVTRFFLKDWNAPLHSRVGEVWEYIDRIRRDPEWRKPWVRRARGDAAWQKNWAYLAGLLRPHGLYLRDEEDEFLAPVRGPDAVLATAFTFSGAMFSRHALKTKIRLWSALIRDDALQQWLAPAWDWWSGIAEDDMPYQEAIRQMNLPPWRADRERHLETGFTATFVDAERRPALPYIRLTLWGVPPPPETVVQWYNATVWERWQDRLWDGRPGLQRKTIPSSETLIRGWALYTLNVHAGLNLREALRAWNTRMPEALQRAAGEGAVMGQEPRASRDRDRARQAAEKLASYFTVD